MKTKLTHMPKIFREIQGLENISGKSRTNFDNEIGVIFERFSFFNLPYWKVNKLVITSLPKNGGLYYSTTKEISLDFNCLSTFIHELGHHIDYSYGHAFIKENTTYSKKSKDKDWLEIVKMFREQHEKHSEKSVTIYVNQGIQTSKTEWDNKDKYYRSAVEIFARSFEIYISQQFSFRVINKTKTSLRKNKMAYPMSKKNLETINKFFERLLNEKNFQ